MRSLPTTSSDPSSLFGAIGGFAGAVAALLVVTGVLDGPTADAIVAVVLAGLPILTALGIRRHAYAPDTVTARERQLRALERGTSFSAPKPEEGRP